MALLRSSAAAAFALALFCGCSKSEPVPAPPLSSASSSPSSSSPERSSDAASPDAGATDAGAPPEGMLLVPGGTFTMGNDKGGEEDERPQHAVTLSPFWLDRTEVTHEDYRACVSAKVCRANSEGVASNYPRTQGPKQPVNGVAWGDAKAYCEWKGKRLPREAEYEHAVRGGDDRRFPWGNDKPTPETTVAGRAIGPGGSNATDDVGTHPLGRGPYGHDDLAGNVWEWMDDEYDPFAYSRKGAATGTPGTCAEIMVALKKLTDEGRQGFTGSNPIPDECEHSIRGGAFNYPVNGLRSTNRVHHPGRYRIVMLGFRCAKDAR